MGENSAFPNACDEMEEETKLLGNTTKEQNQVLTDQKVRKLSLFNNSKNRASHSQSDHSDEVNLDKVTISFLKIVSVQIFQ